MLPPYLQNHKNVIRTKCIFFLMIQINLEDYKRNPFVWHVQWACSLFAQSRSLPSKKVKYAHLPNDMWDNLLCISAFFGSICQAKFKSFKTLHNVAKQRLCGTWRKSQFNSREVYVHCTSTRNRYGFLKAQLIQFNPYALVQAQSLSTIL